MKKINYYTPINQTGYGIASLNILKSLDKLGYDFTYFPIGKPSVASQNDYDIVTKHYTDIPDPSGPCVKIWHQFDLTNKIGNGRYFAYSFFELDTFNDLEKRSMLFPDVFLTSSQWASDVLKENGITQPTSIIPLGVDRSIFDHEKFTKTQNLNKYIFLTIGKWEVRKCHDILPEIFKKAFPTETDVELWILASTTTNSYSTQKEVEDWKRLYSYDSRLKVLDSVPTHYDIARLIGESDAGIYLSHAEGWNLELLETMAMNKPVISTNYSAHKEFCNENNCLLVDIEEKEKAYDGKAFQGQGYWAKIEQKQIDRTIDYMRFLYNNRLNTNENGVETSKIYSWENSAKKLIGCINEYA